MNSAPWSERDLKQMKVLGIHPGEASRQIQLFKNPPSFISLSRPAAHGDGLFRLTPRQKELATRFYQEAALKGRFSKFVPASGAASRMFQLLMKFQQRGPVTRKVLLEEIQKGDKECRQFLDFMRSLPKMAFADDLRSALSKKKMSLETLLRTGRFNDILDCLFSPFGLNYAQKPKALIRFHSYSSGSRTPLEEQLVEAAKTVLDKNKTGRVHFTVSAEHKEDCLRHLGEIRKKVEKKYGVKFDVQISIQGKKTNTLAVDERDRPFRDESGGLIFRPSGHGALLENLNQLGGDLVYIKNIDNVAVENKLEAAVYWKKILGGFLAMTQAGVFDALKKLNSKNLTPGELDLIERWVGNELHLVLGKGFQSLSASGKKRELIKLLDRPIRVCGVVPNTGEPGGGPFWVKGKASESLQIVESAQVHFGLAGQKRIFQKSTHFNPVDLVCALRNWHGKPFDLRRFRDPNAVFISKKSFKGRDLKALELPGLWNGAMAYWITLFVEVPLETFNPVKTVFDLLKPAHQS